MKFWSDVFDDHQPMPSVHTADGENINPSFIIKDVPAGTKQLVLICHDPDATGGAPWTHWMVGGISPTCTAIAAGELPKGAREGQNSFGARGYGGPDPTPGTGPHRYVFSLYALAENVPIDDSTRRDELLDRMAGHLLAQSVWTGIYEHPAA